MCFSQSPRNTAARLRHAHGSTLAAENFCIFSVTPSASDTSSGVRSEQGACGMTPATSPPPTAPPDDPVGRVLADSAVRGELLNHALAILDRWLADKPHAVREVE